MFDLKFNEELFGDQTERGANTVVSITSAERVRIEITQYQILTQT